MDGKKQRNKSKVLPISGMPVNFWATIVPDGSHYMVHRLQLCHPKTEVQEEVLSSGLHC